MVVINCNLTCANTLGSRACLGKLCPILGSFPNMSKLLLPYEMEIIVGPTLNDY